VDPEDVKQSTTARTITLRIAKKEDGPYWPRLLKAAGKPAPYIKVDWDRWVDEDEEAEDDMAGFEQMGGGGMGGGGMGDMASMMQGMGGGGGMGDMASMMGGMGGGGGMDMASLMAQMGQGGGGGFSMPEGGDEEEEGDGSEGDDDLPPLEAPAPQ
jgi:hypothetical protein